MLRRGRVSRRRAGAEVALHMQATKMLETLSKKYLLVEIGDTDRLCITNIDRGRNDPRHILAVV
jgi:hypothetical protein